MFLCVPVFVLDGTLHNVFGTSSDIFGYYWTPTKNLGPLKMKNVTPINVKRLAGISEGNLLFHVLYLHGIGHKLVISQTSKFTCNFSFCGRMMSLILNRKQKSRGNYNILLQVALSLKYKPLYQTLNYLLLLSDK